MAKQGSSRREFLGVSVAAGAAVGLGSVAPGWMGRALAVDAPKRLRVLVLGGTGQTGPSLVERALERGHEVTLFNRGNRSAEMFPEVECLVGDRYPDKGAGLSALEEAVSAGRKWDVAIDVWPHIPKLVEATAELLKENAGHYMFVSSMSVYVNNAELGQDETAEVGQAPDADNQEFGWELFGPFKAECENRVRAQFPKNHTIYRPGLIVGPRDFSFRGGYWPVRVREGGEVLAPGTGEGHIQQVDARDLTTFQVHCMEQGTSGTFNVVGPHPDQPLTMRKYLHACKKASASDATFTWADAEFLAGQGVGPWMNMPCWLPAEGEYAGFGHRKIDKALAAGLTLRPIVETVRDTLVWYGGLEEDKREGLHARAGISREREAEVLAAWHGRAAE